MIDISGMNFLLNKASYASIATAGQYIVHRIRNKCNEDEKGLLISRIEFNRVHPRMIQDAACLSVREMWAETGIDSRM